MDTKQKYADLERETLAELCAAMERFMRAYGVWHIFAARAHEQAQTELDGRLLEGRKQDE